VNCVEQVRERSPGLDKQIKERALKIDSSVAILFSESKLDRWRWWLGRKGEN